MKDIIEIFKYMIKEKHWVLRKEEIEAINKTIEAFELLPELLEIIEINSDCIDHNSDCCYLQKLIDPDKCHKCNVEGLLKQAKGLIE